jgi:WD40 repeat protein
MNGRICLFCVVLLCCMPGLKAAESREVNLDDVMTGLAGSQDAMEIFLNSLSAIDLVHWSKTSRLYRQLFKEELLKRKDLVAWAKSDLKSVTIECDACSYNAIVFSPDGKKFAACGHIDRGFLIQVFEKASLRVEQTFNIPGMVNKFCFSPDNKILAVSNGYDKVFLYDVASGEQMTKVDGLQMVFCPDTTLLTATIDGNLFRWDVKTGKKVGSLVLDQGELIRKFLMAVIFSSDGKKLIGSLDSSIIVWNCEDGKRLKEFKTLPISGLVLSPNNKVLAGRDTFLIRLLDFANGNILKVINGDFLSMAFFPDNRILATAERLKKGKMSIKLVHIRSGHVINDLRDEDLVGAIVLSVSPEGEILAACSRNKIILWYRDSDEHEE